MEIFRVKNCQVLTNKSIHAGDCQGGTLWFLTLGSSIIAPTCSYMNFSGWHHHLYVHLEKSKTKLSFISASYVSTKKIMDPTKIIFFLKKSEKGLDLMSQIACFF